MDEQLLPVGTSVVVDGDTFGTICGYGTYTRDGKSHMGYMVKVDTGFWSEDRKTYVSIIVAHVNCTKELEK